MRFFVPVRLHSLTYALFDFPPRLDAVISNSPLGFLVHALVSRVSSQRYTNDAYLIPHRPILSTRPVRWGMRTWQA